MKRVKFISILSGTVLTSILGIYIYLDQTTVNYVQGKNTFYRSFDNIKDRVQNADLIVDVTMNGTPENILIDENGFTSGYTATPIKINKVLKGNDKISADAEIKIREPYYTVDNGLSPGKTVISYEDYTGMENGLRYILFLSYNESSQLYGVSSLHEGKYNLDNNDNKELLSIKRNTNYEKLKEAVLSLTESQVQSLDSLK